MGAGRPPTPSVLRKLSGSNLDRLNKREARFRSPDTVNVPKRVGDSPEAKALWDELVPELIDNGLLTRANQSLFADLCVLHAVLMAAHDDLTSRGRTLEEPVFNRQGEETGIRDKPNPAIAQIVQLSALKQRLMSEFGLTPASATRVAADPKDSKDGFSFLDEDEENSEVRPS